MSGEGVVPQGPAPPRRGDFDDAVRYLEDLRASDVRPGLERISWLCGELGDPQRCAPVVHVTGTNGKGSTSRLVSAALSASGRSCGLYTSPHLERLVERVAIDGEPISNDELTALVGRIAPIGERANATIPSAPTHFETLTALGFAAFADHRVDAIVLEVGLGGRFDATNVADGRVAVVTNVALDHTDVLGATKERIAEMKSGIIKPGAIAVIGEGDPEVHAVIERRCREVGAISWLIGRDVLLESDAPAPGGRVITVRTPRGRYADVLVPFHGAHQARNAACALAALDAFSEERFDRDVLADAWRNVPNPARFEIVEGTPRVVIDVAHNPHGLQALVATLDELFPGRRRVIVVGVNPHKDAEPMLAQLRAHHRALITTQVLDAPSVPAAALAKVAESLGFAMVRPVADARSAVDAAFELASEDDVIVCTGSHYWIGAVRQAILGRVRGGASPGG